MDPDADNRAHTVQWYMIYKKYSVYVELQRRSKPEYQSEHKQTNPIVHGQKQCPINKQRSRKQYDKTKLQTNRRAQKRVGRRHTMKHDKLAVKHTSQTTIKTNLVFIDLTSP